MLEPFDLVVGDAHNSAHAATIFASYRAKVAGTATIEALIAAITIGREAAFLTTNADLGRMAKVVPVKLLAVRT